VWDDVQSMGCQMVVNKVAWASSSGMSTIHPILPRVWNLIYATSKSCGANDIAVSMLREST
jgi:hypothetical protein